MRERWRFAASPFVIFTGVEVWCGFLWKAVAMQYLGVSEYGTYGLSGETRDDLVVAASAMVDAFCRRPSLGVTQYVERLRFGRGRSVQLSNAPLAAASEDASALVAVRVRMRPMRDAAMCHPLAEAAEVFGVAGAWSSVDGSGIDVAADGLLTFAPNLLGCAFDEAEVTYTAGYAVIPAAVKVACAQVVRNAQAMPALSVKRQAIDSMQMEYFSGTLLDADVQRLLQPYVSQRMG